MASVIQVNLGSGVDAAKETFDKMSSFVVSDASKKIADSVMKRGAETAKAEIEMVIAQIESQVQDIIDKDASLLYNSLGINRETAEFAKKVVLLGRTATSFAGASVLKGMLALNNFDTYSIPMSSLAAGLLAIASFADKFFQKFIEAYGKYIDNVAEYIVNPGSAIELLKDAMDTMLLKMLDMVDEQTYNYLGLSMAQIKYYTRKGWNLYMQYKAAKKAVREGKDTEDTQEGINVSETKVNVNVKPYLNPTLLRELLMLWLASQRDSLYNGFMILQVVDAVNSLKGMVKCLTDVNLESLADTMNSLDDLMLLLDLLGVSDGSNAVDLSLVPSLNLNDIYASLNNLSDTQKAVDELQTLGGIVARSADFEGMVSTQKQYEISTDAKSKEITLTFYTDPTSQTISKKIYKVLTESKNAEGKPLFTMSECSSIQLAIKKVYDSGQKQTSLKAGIYTVNIKLSIDLKKDNLYNSQDVSEHTDKKVFSLAVMNEEMLSKDEVDRRRNETRRNTIALLHSLYSILKALWPQLKQFATLTEWYRKNKAYARSKSQENLFQLYAEVMKKLGFSNEIKFTNGNPDKYTTIDEYMGSLSYCIYTVRTFALYNFLKNSINLIDGNSATYDVDVRYAKVINDWLDTNDVGSIHADGSRGRLVLFIDYAAISIELRCMELKKQQYEKALSTTLSESLIKCDSKYRNGTFNDIENMELVGNRLLYSDKNLPRNGSQIMMAQMRGYEY